MHGALLQSLQSKLSVTHLSTFLSLVNLHMWEVLTFQITTILWGYVAYTSKTSFYYKQKSVSNLELHFTVGGKQSENCTEDISKARTSANLFKQQHYKTEIYR